ncbi:Putative phosphatidylinositol-specific phospholipase C, X domain-containing protein [Septoria linicola]|uniref:Phosphatidylinositol-specific phospholipase C, X domain-containing protein n=1 Tax=Septoria linicola TaxID=215465 RepID=A0A9Q9AWX4_9PEZI|nr:putative phosphatidylinositol-specific phospholipase C, X domain-containing protein [Septoria linicola]USW56645.1 Putative phosphatidylinositol-specific phospholipase C, X domain-containing protein [Septoria linicola]
MLATTFNTSPAWRIVHVFSLVVAALLILSTLGSLASPSLNFPWQTPSRTRTGSGSDYHQLAYFALQKVLDDAQPIFGHGSSLLASPYAPEPATATWMKAYHDETKVVHLNLPGAHDAATWNYSHATQDALDYVNGLANISAVEPANYKCQSRSIIQMLTAGIRVFDLRYAFDVTRTALVFWHGDALQSETATVEDVMYAFYAWLDLHPSEALFLSFQHEGGDNDMQTQLSLHEILSSHAAKQYIVQSRGELGTLKQARGKITLLKRFDLDSLPEEYEKSLPGLHFSPLKWTVNGADIELIYNSSTDATAYIEDYYYPLTEIGSTAATNIRWKMNATEAHIHRAASAVHEESLFWGFASSTKTNNEPPDTPAIQALGNGTLTPKGGVNAQLVNVLKKMQGKRLGMMMFDFFEEPEDLVPLYLSLLSPDEARDYSRIMTDV